MLSLLFIVIVSNSAFLILAYRFGQAAIFHEVGSAALSVASTTAMCIDPTQYQKLNLQTKEESAEYQSLEKQLRKIRNVNRRDDIYVHRIYGLFPDAKNSKIQRFAVDAEEHGLEKKNVGNVMRFKTQSGKWIEINYKKPLILPEFIEDIWGNWLTALYPLEDEQGRHIGNIRVDMSADDVVERFHLLLVSGLLIFIFMLVSAVVLGWLLVRWFNRPLMKITASLKAISQGDLKQHLEITGKDEFAEIATIINTMTEGLRQRDMLQTSLTRYISHALAERIVNTGELPQLSSERRKVTIMICDIRNFTGISEHIKPEEVVAFLNEFFEAIIEAITAQQGILDKYLGDGFLAIFGTPSDDSYQEDHAIHAALKIRKIIPGLNAKWREKLGMPIEIGIGINTGSAIVGNIGTDIHMEYTAIGDTVNLASRIEMASKELNTDIIISEYTYISADHRAFQFKQLGDITVRGREQKVKVFTVSS